MRCYTLAAWKYDFGSGFAKKRKPPVLFLETGMIRHYNEHAANERTYLAWIRTSIAIMTFGFLIEKFDLFITHMGYAQLMGTESGILSVRAVGVVLLFVSMGMITMATARFHLHRKAIDSEGNTGYGILPTLFLAVALGGLVGLMTWYLGHLLS